MSSSSNQLPSVSSEFAASSEDLELFQRLLRVARLLKTHGVDDLWNQNPTLAQPTRHDGTGSAFLGPDVIGNTLRRTKHAAGTDNNYNDDDDYDDDEDEEDEEWEKAKEDSTNAAVPISQSVIPGNKTRQLSRRKESSNQQDNTGPAPQRQSQRQQQLQQQQHHHHHHHQQHQQLYQQQQLHQQHLPQQHPEHPPQQQEQRPHAAVEKRYRSVVNSKIQQLNASIPASMTFSPTEPNTSPETQVAGAAQEMPTKSIVLDRATQYINHLASMYEQYETERNELRRRLQFWLDNISSAETHLENRSQD